jgi:Holliday junction DNA helicase RuvA
MIAHLNGRLIHKSTESIIVDANGVGYELCIPLSTYYNLPEEREPVALNVYTHLKDDAIQLFGFLTLEEKEVFRLLISVSGVGPKLARNILSGVAVPDLVASIAEGDKARLSSIPGIGGKSADRLIVELKDRVGGLSAAHAAAGLTVTEPVTGDVVSALGNLGYRQGQAEEAVKKARAALEDGAGFEGLLKEALKCLAKR